MLFFGTDFDLGIANRRPGDMRASALAIGERQVLMGVTLGEYSEYTSLRRYAIILRPRSS